MEDASPPPGDDDSLPVFRPSEKKKQRTSGAGGEDDTNPPKPPTYDPNALARTVFADPYFYDDEADLAAFCASYREKAFKEDTTVDDVKMEFNIDRDPHNGSAALMERIRVSAARLRAYYDVATTEQILHGNVIVVSGDSHKDVDRYNSQEVYDLPSLNRIFYHFQPQSQQPHDGPGPGPGPVRPAQTRNSQICVVTGSSGSGKTYFCLRYLPRFLPMSPDELVLVAYLQPSAASLNSVQGAAVTQWREKVDRQQDGDDAGNRIGTRIGREVVELVRHHVLEKFRRPVRASLSMRVCLIFDEAGALSLKGLFEDHMVLHDIYSHIHEHLATNVVMAVAGTGITGKLLKSKSDAFFFRLQPWDASDLRNLLNPHVETLRLNRGEEVQTVLDAIYAQPKLRALTTNARSAHFLVEAILFLCRAHVEDMWKVQMDAWTPAIVSKVVHEYIYENGIRDLDQRRRALVAASVFHALRETKHRETDLPNFPVLDSDLDAKAVAIALVTYNVERVSNEATVHLLAGETHAVSVTPAISIVLFTMLGLQVSMIPGWRAEEEVAGLYAARRLILDRVDRYLTKEPRESTVENLKDELVKIRLVALQKQIQAPIPIRRRQRERHEGSVRVPLVSPASVVVNGEKSSFADVIAPYMLLQAKHTSTGEEVSVNMEKELDKCCLLTPCTDDRVLRGLLALWRGSLQLTTGDSAVKRAKNDLPQRTSRAYPENLVKYGTPSDVVHYASIASYETVISTANTQLELPTFDENDVVTYILVTNAPCIYLKDLKMRIDPSKVDERGRLKPAACTPDETQTWESLQARVKSRTHIEFLFTTSSA